MVAGWQISAFTPPRLSPKRKEAAGRGERHNFLLRSLQLEGNHAAEAGHLLPRNVVPGMLGQAREVDALHQRMPIQRVGDGNGVFFVPLHSQFERFHAAQRQPTIEGRRNRAGGVLQKLDGLEYGRVFGQRRALNRVGVARQIFRHAMDHDVGAQLEGLLEIGRRESVVDHNQRALLA